MNDFLDKLLAMDDEPTASPPAQPGASPAPATPVPAPAAPMPAAPAPTRTLTARDALAGFRDRFPPVAVPLSYRIRLAFVALLLLVNLAVYLAMIAGFGWLCVFLGTLAGEVNHVRSAVFLGLAAIGSAVMVFVFVRPLWRLIRAKSAPGITVLPSAEPELYAFVNTIAGLVGAPTPRLIMANCDVNAAAGLIGGVRGIFRRRLALHLGLPLAGGLTCSQLAGVIGHEFGHFSQHGGIRTTALIRTVERIFFVIALDLRRIQAGSTHWLLDIPFWVPRLVLTGLVAVSTVASRALNREMERDADRYETRLVGSETFAATARRLAELKFALGVTLETTPAKPKNLPRLVLANHRDLPLEVRRAIRQSLDGGQTRWQDTHPSDAERIAQAMAEATPGVYACDAPAIVLFRDFDGLAQAATRDPQLAVG